jgi:hypothetical protein
MSKVVHLSDDSHNKAKDFCKQHRLRMSDWVAALIDDAIARNQTEVARSTVAKKKPMKRLDESAVAPVPAPAPVVAAVRAPPKVVAEIREELEEEEIAAPAVPAYAMPPFWARK